VLRHLIGKLVEDVLGRVRMIVGHVQEERLAKLTSGVAFQHLSHVFVEYKLRNIATLKQFFFDCLLTEE